MIEKRGNVQKMDLVSSSWILALYLLWLCKHLQDLLLCIAKVHISFFSDMRKCIGHSFDLQSIFTFSAETILCKGKLIPQKKSLQNDPTGAFVQHLIYLFEINCVSWREAL